MKLSYIRIAISLAAFLALSTRLVGLPPQVVVESRRVKIAIDLADGSALLKSITNKDAGDVVTFAPESADFVLTTDGGELTRKDFRVTNVIDHGRVVYIVLDGESLAVTERYEVFDSGCVKRSLEVFPKVPVFLQKIALVNLMPVEKPSDRVAHKSLFLKYGKGGLFFDTEMPLPSRVARISKDGHIVSNYEPMRRMKPGDSLVTRPLVMGAWKGDLAGGYEAARSYTYELSVTRQRAIATVSSQSAPEKEAAYDAYKALDDDPNTRWMTKTDMGGKHWLEVEFPEPVTFNTFLMTLDNRETRPMLDNPPPIGAYHLQAWTGGKWTDLATATNAPTGKVRFADTVAAKIRLTIDGCYGRFSLWDFQLYRDADSPHVLPENLCSKLWADQDIPMPFTYYNTWYARFKGYGSMERTTLLTYKTIVPTISMAAQCGLENLVMDAYWKYDWWGTGLNPKWPTEFPEGEKPFTEAADKAGVKLAAWFHFFRLRGDKYDWQWRAVNKDGNNQPGMCLLSGYYDFAKDELLRQIRNSHMKLVKFDGFVPPSECYAKNHNHEPGPVRDAQYLAFIQMIEEIRKQYPDFRMAIYSGAWDASWIKYAELIHTYEDHGGITAGELAPTHAKAVYMHDRELFNAGYWDYLLYNQIEGSTIIGAKTLDWREEVIGNLAQSTRRQISTDLGAFTPDERNWIRDCMNWSRVNARFLCKIRPFFPNRSVTEPWGNDLLRGLSSGLRVEAQQSNTLEGYAHISGNEGYVFIFNPTLRGAEYSIPVTETLGFDSAASRLSFRVIYPYTASVAEGMALGGTVKGYLPAAKHVVIKVTRNPDPMLLPGCAYTAQDTIWDYSNLTAVAAPDAKGGVFKTKLTPPVGVVLGSVTVNGDTAPVSKDGSCEITLQRPIAGRVDSSVEPTKAKAGRKTTSARVTVLGDLANKSLMLFLYKPGKAASGKLPKAEPGQMVFRLLIDGKPVEGRLGETMDWEPEKTAGWWVFDLPAVKKTFRASVETSDTVRPVLLLSARQDRKAAEMVVRYSKVSKGMLTTGDPDAFLHADFPDGPDYFPILDLREETRKGTSK